MARDFTAEALEEVARRFKVLSEPTRLRILNGLREGEKTVGALVRELDTGQANVSKHLGILQRHGLVARRQEGVHAYYRIADPAVFELCELVCRGIESDLAARQRALGRD